MVTSKCIGCNCGTVRIEAYELKKFNLSTSQINVNGLDSEIMIYHLTSPQWRLP